MRFIVKGLIFCYTLTRIIYLSGSISPQSVDLINAVTRSNIKYKTKKGKVNKCTAMEEIKKEYISQGITQGIDLGQFRTLVSLTKKKYHH